MTPSMANENLVPSVAQLGMESDDEDLDNPQQGQPASNIQQRRRAQKAIFEAWITSTAAQEALKPKTKQAQIKDADDEQLSIQSLMTKQGTEIIKSPRDYQLELFERAKKENTIAVLDTGSGKTLIAVLLLRWIIDQELEDRAALRPPRISFFLVASVTLVYQQFAVLETNLDHKVARVCGGDNTDNWSKAKWLKLFADNKVIVCTADVLVSCLAHSFITMRQINLLIFDEAHHTKKNHAYARIIKDFYLAENNVATRPRVFGMTASPVDAKTDVNQAASELETLLHSRIATTQDMSLTDAVKRPAESILRYNALSECFETELLRTIEKDFGHIEAFSRVFESAPYVARELGVWCADRHLVQELSEKKLRRYEFKVEQKFYAHSCSAGVNVLDEKLAELRTAFDFVAKEYALSGASLNAPSAISSKVRELQNFLKYQFERPSSQRCIIFVDRRKTARLLAALFQRIGTKHMQSSFLVGGNTRDIGEEGMTFKQQVLTLMKFRKGDVNCLFSTSVAEEGLDVPDCNLVIRFDMYKTMIQYVQSRGRARQRNSKFIHMLEKDNSIHDQLVSQIRYQELAMRNFCQALPEDRRLIGNEDTLETLMSKEKLLRVYTEPSTGAKLTYGNALSYLANFVSAIPNDTDEILYPTYVVSSHASNFIAEVVLPANAPITSAIGRIYTKKSLAKRSAAFEACLELRKRQKMNEHFMPTYQKKLPAMRNALLAVGMNKSDQYEMRTKPSVWEHTRGTLPSELYITIIDFPDGLDRKHQPLALLTRTRMPQFPTFPIFLQDGSESRVVSQPLLNGLKVDEEQINKLSAFTFRVFKDVFSKTYEANATNLSYWLAPAVISTTSGDETLPHEALHWELLDEVFENDEYTWTPQMSNSFLCDKFLVDKWDGGRKWYSIAIAEHLTPLDPVPDGTAKAKFSEHILGYTVSLWKKARERAEWKTEQPVMEATMISFRRNMLATPDTKEMKVNTKAFLCPEPLRISALTPAVVASCFVWPAVIYRFESYLTAIEACDMIGVECEPSVALAAVTKDSDNSGEHENQERVNFQKGMGENYERLEFIGDTFLKTATTIAIFIQNPNDNEFDFHVKRMLLLCNKNLFEVAQKLKLYEYVRSMAFSRRLWYPQGLKLLEGKGAGKIEETAVIKHSLAEKTIADVCEALIGAAFVTHDKPGEKWHESQWENAVRAVTKLVGSPDHTMTKWDDYRTAYHKPAYQTGNVTAAQKDLAEKVELEHYYHFTYPRLLYSAFVHPSQAQMQERVPHYQRLEFLGDALLDMASITHIFYLYPDKDPQWLTEHKMAMVSNKFLGAVCVNLGFHKHLRYSSTALEGPIRHYATDLLEAKNAPDAGKDYWTNVADPPKCLPDIVESYVGAMFVDSDFDYNVVQRFFDEHVKWYFEDMTVYDGFANNHPCTNLHTTLQQEFGCQDYRLMAREMPAPDDIKLERADVVAVVMIHNEIVSHSVGKSGKYARVRAAKEALEAIKNLAPYQFRANYGCDCKFEPVEDSSKGSKVAADCSI